MVAVVPLSWAPGELAEGVGVGVVALHHSPPMPGTCG